MTDTEAFSFIESTLKAFITISELDPEIKSRPFAINLKVPEEIILRFLNVIDPLVVEINPEFIPVNEELGDNSREIFSGYPIKVLIPELS